MSRREELRCIYDGHKSFHGKAEVVVFGPNVFMTSYECTVVKFNELKGFAFYPLWDYSATTLRHVKEFLKQAGETNIQTKRQIKKRIDDPKDPWYQKG